MLQMNKAILGVGRSLLGSKLFNHVVKSFPFYKKFQIYDAKCGHLLCGMGNVGGSICPIDNAVPNLPCQLIEHILLSLLLSPILSSFSHSLSYFFQIFLAR